MGSWGSEQMGVLGTSMPSQGVRPGVRVLISSEKTRTLSLVFSAAQGGKIGQVGGVEGSPKLGEVTPNLKAADQGLLPNCARAQTAVRGKRGAIWTFARNAPCSGGSLQAAFLHTP